MDAFTGAPNYTMAHFIYHRLANPENPCYLLDGDTFLKYNPEKVVKHRFLVGPSINVERITGMAYNMFERNIYFNEKSFFETLRVFYLSKRLTKAKRDFINLCISTLFTHGIFIKTIRDVRFCLLLN